MQHQHEISGIYLFVIRIITAIIRIIIAIISIMKLIFADVTVLQMLNTGNSCNH